MAYLYGSRFSSGARRGLDTGAHRMAAESARQACGHRPLHVIADEIADDWRPVYFAAAPYLRAMQSLHGLAGHYGAESGRSVVTYFLGNARTWKGPIARRIKAELRAILKGQPAADAPELPVMRARSR